MEQKTITVGLENDFKWRAALVVEKNSLSWSLSGHQYLLKSSVKCRKTWIWSILKVSKTIRCQKLEHWKPFSSDWKFDTDKCYPRKISIMQHQSNQLDRIWLEYEWGCSSLAEGLSFRGPIIQYHSPGNPLIQSNWMRLIKGPRIDAILFLFHLIKKTFISSSAVISRNMGSIQTDHDEVIVLEWMIAVINDVFNRNGGGGWSLYLRVQISQFYYDKW